MSISSNELETHISKLESQLGIKKLSNKIDNKKLPIRLSSTHTILILITIIGIILFITSPRFICDEYIDDANKQIYIKSIKKIVMWTMLFTLFIVVGYYGYTYKM